MKDRHGNEVPKRGDPIVLQTIVMFLLLYMGIYLYTCPHAETQNSSAPSSVGKKHDNSLGVVMSFDNPMTYKAGAVVAIAYIKDGLVVRIQPLGTYSLFTEDITICGEAPDKFLNKSNPMVLTYRTKASRMLEGIGCHELVNVASLKTTKELQ